MSEDFGTIPPPDAPPPHYSPAAQPDGLSDNAAGAIAYITFLPAVLFLLIAPYKYKPFIRFHCIQNLGLVTVMLVAQFFLFLMHVFLIIPILGWLIYLLGWIFYLGLVLCLVVVWILAIYSASQGRTYKAPFIGNFAARHAGYTL